MVLSATSSQFLSQSSPNDLLTITTGQDALRLASHHRGAEARRLARERARPTPLRVPLLPSLDVSVNPRTPASSTVPVMGPASPASALPHHARPNTSGRLDPDLLPVHDAAPDYARRSLLSAARRLKTMGLDNAALWALELVNCIPDDGDRAVGSSSSRGSHFFEDQARSQKGRGASTRHGADSSLSWQGSFAPTSTPARPSSSRKDSLQQSPANAYPMQSTPFLGAAGGLASNPIMISGPSSSPLPLASPHRDGVGMLGANNSPSPLGESMARGDASTSASGRFPPPFRQPPSPLATMSLSASTDRPSKSKEGLRSDDDQSMLDDGEVGETDRVEASHSAHVHFAEGGDDISNVPKLDIFEAYSDPAKDSGPMEDAEFHLAMTYFRLGQLDRCKWLLERRRETLRRKEGGDEGDKARFLRGYVTMLVSSRQIAVTDSSTLRALNGSSCSSARSSSETLRRPAPCMLHRRLVWPYVSRLSLS